MIASRSGGHGGGAGGGGGGHHNRGGGGQHSSNNSKKNGLGRRSTGSSTDGEEVEQGGANDDQKVSTQKVSTQKTDDSQNDQGALVELLIDPAEDLFSLAPYNKAIHDNTIDEYNEYTNMPMIHGRSFVQQNVPKKKRLVYTICILLAVLNVYIHKYIFIHTVYVFFHLYF